MGKNKGKRSHTKEEKSMILHSSPSLRDVQNIKSLISPLLGDVVINQV